ncbi:MAG TPA: 6-phosphogluconolactonase [bacterium]|nr:6-phosphogluconolactonase [bacterium]
MKPLTKIYENPDELTRAAAEESVIRINESLARRKTCTLVLAGGNTPRPLYQLLATEYAHRIPWENVHLYWGDERFVPHDHDQSNYRMVRESLLKHISVPSENVHPIPTEHPTVVDCAQAYEIHLQAEFRTEFPEFDLVLLGLGTDGHTASLFPGTDAILEQENWVCASEAPDPPKERITLTYPVLNSAKSVFFLVSGEQKAEAVRNASQEVHDRNACPAAFIRPERGQVIWWLDRPAAAQLSEEK